MTKLSVSVSCRRVARRGALLGGAGASQIIETILPRQPFTDRLRQYLVFVLR